MLRAAFSFSFSSVLSLFFSFFLKKILHASVTVWAY